MFSRIVTAIYAAGYCAILRGVIQELVLQVAEEVLHKR